MEQPPYTMLLVEDNPTDVLLMRGLLKKLPSSPPFDLTVVGRLGEALRAVEQHPFHVALVDLGLPDSQGLETCHTLHRHAPRLPIVILTGADDADIVPDVVNAGAQDYLVKDMIDARILRRTVRYAIERQRSSEEMLRLQDQLRQAKTMAAMGTLSGGIAHHFNNILHIMFGQIELTSMELRADDPGKIYLASALDAGIRAKDLIQQMLVFCRDTTAEQSWLVLQQIVGKALTALPATLPDTIKVHEHLDAEGLMIRADERQILQIMINLCANAEYAMRATGGVIKVQLTPHDVTEDAVHPELKPGPHLRLTVRDTGHGMTPEVLEKVFDPFFTTRDVGQGMGMGLAIVHGLMSTYGGAITVESEPQQGTTFSCYFPQINAPESGTQTFPI